MMTGNIIMMANACTTGNITHAHDGNVFPDLLFYGLIIIAHYFGLFLHTIASQLYQYSFTMLINGPIILLLTFITEVTAASGSVPARWAVYPVAVCFGLQSAITNHVIGFATILATGHLTNIFACLNHHILGAGMTGKPDQLRVNFGIIYALVVGCLLGAWVNMHSHGFVFTPAVLAQVGAGNL